jgi:hypothetical protein
MLCALPQTIVPAENNKTAEQNKVLTLKLPYSLPLTWLVLAKVRCWEISRIPNQNHRGSSKRIRHRQKRELVDLPKVDDQARSEVCGKRIFI